MNLKKLRIVVDERERKSGIPDLLKGIGINLEIKTLPVGDYIVAPETVVERKTISDLISSIFDGRLFDQCNRLKEHYQFPILLIEGDFDEIEELTENPFVFYGAISSIALDFKIPVIQKAKVESQTLKAFAKEQVQNGHEIPMDLFGVYVANKTIIKEKAKLSKPYQYQGNSFQSRNTIKSGKSLL